MGRVFAALCALIMTSACSTTLSPDVRASLVEIGATAAAPAAPSGALTVIDQRGPDARKFQGVPLGIAGGFSCNLGVVQLGDDAFAPDRLARLENALAAAFPDRVDGAVMTARRYDIYLNHSAESHAQSMNAAFGGGIIPALIAPMPNTQSSEVTREPRCEPERMTGGWFDQADLTHNLPPITVELDVTVFGKDYRFNMARSPELNLYLLDFRFRMRSDPDIQPAVEAIVQRSMDKAHAYLVTQIAASAEAQTSE